MIKNKVWFNFFLALICFFAFTVSLFGTYFMLTTSGNVFAQTVGNCSDLPEVQIDTTPPFGDSINPNIPPGFAISGVWIKGGNTCFGPFITDGIFEDDIDGEEACFEVAGIGTTSISVTKTGNGETETCADIAQIEVIWEDDSPPVSPSATPAVTISITPTITQTANVTPNPENELGLTPIPEATPSADTQNPTNTPGPTGSVLGSQTEATPTITTLQGQVLGATTLPETASNKAEVLFILGFAVVSLLAYFLTSGVAL